MSEEEARKWIRDSFGSSAELKMQTLVEKVVDEAGRQNLIAPSTLNALWARHVVDSAQLIGLADRDGCWLDVGTGAGFPGMVAALLTDRAIILVEPRKRRASFLEDMIHAFDLGARVTVMAGKVEALEASVSIISARAVSSLSNLFAAAVHCSTPDTQWILPKGRNAREEVTSASRAWHGVFHVKQSITDPQSLIVLASGVSCR